MKDQINTIREALNLATDGPVIDRDGLMREALAALTQLEAMVESVEPVAWRVHPFDYGIGHEGVYATTHLTQQRDAWMRKGWNVESLYTAAPVAQQYEAGDMASAAAQGFRDGVASVAQQPSKATLEKLRAWETNGELIDRAWQVLQSQEQEIMRLEKMLAEERAQQPQAEAVPPGYVLVPVEPTDSMFFDPDEVCVNFKETPWSAFCRIYKSMLDAAIAQQKGQP